MSEECSIIERCKIVKIIAKLLLNCNKLLNRFKISKFGYNSSGLWGWAGFLSVDWFIPALTQKTDQQHQHQITIHQHLQPSCKPTTSSVSVNRVFQVERAVFVISVPVPWVCLLCHYQYAR